MAQLAIAINVSGRVVCERRRCSTKKKSPRRIQADGGAGVYGAVSSSRAGGAYVRYMRVRRHQRRVAVGSPSTGEANVQKSALRRLR